MKILTNNNHFKAIWIGHSFGGKVAISAALNHSHHVTGLIPIEIGIYSSHMCIHVSQYMHHIIIAPVDYKSKTATQIQIIKTLQEVQELKFDNLSHLKGYIYRNQPKLTSFDVDYLTSSFYKNKTGEYITNLNLSTLLSEMDPIIYFEEQHSNLHYHGPTIFLGGSQSNYIKSEKHAPIMESFFGSNYTIKYMPGNHMIFDEDYTQFMDHLFLPSLQEIDELQ